MAYVYGQLPPTHANYGASYYSHPQSSYEAPAPSAYSPAAGAGNHKVLAERYKTKMCRNFLETGACPYEARCMFAHGEHELRSTEMNLRDGLVTEDAIRHYKRIMQAKAMELEAGIEQPPNYDQTLTNNLLGDGSSPTTPCEAYCTCAQCVPQTMSRAGSSVYSRGVSSFAQESSTASYHHNPYAWASYDDLSAQQEDCTAAANTEVSCQCAECLYRQTPEFYSYPQVVPRRAAPYRSPAAQADYSRQRAYRQVQAEYMRPMEYAGEAQMP